MATECFKIEWTGYYSLDKAKNQPEAKKLGLYAVYRVTSYGERILWYLGKATEIRARLNQHIQSWQKAFPPRELDRLQITIGALTSLDGKSATQVQLKHIESMFLNEYHPKGNAKSTMKGYKGRSILVVSNGKIGQFSKLTTHDKHLLKLLRAA